MSFIVRRGREVCREAQVVEVYIDEWGGRCVRAECPWCLGIHEHSVPVDTLPGARLERSPRCGANKGVYLLVGLDP
jgi:hypothetical protein